MIINFKNKIGYRVWEEALYKAFPGDSIYSVYYPVDMGNAYSFNWIINSWNIDGPMYDSWGKDINIVIVFIDLAMPTGGNVKKSYNFFPVPENNIRAYHISDAHNSVDAPIKAANTFGSIDFLILNGDVIEDS